MVSSILTEYWSGEIGDLDSTRGKTSCCLEMLEKVRMFFLFLKQGGRALCLRVEAPPIALVAYSVNAHPGKRKVTEQNVCAENQAEVRSESLLLPLTTNVQILHLQTQDMLTGSTTLTAVGSLMSCSMDCTVTRSETSGDYAISKTGLAHRLQPGWMKSSRRNMVTGLTGLTAKLKTKCRSRQ